MSTFTIDELVKVDNLPHMSTATPSKTATVILNEDGSPTDIDVLIGDILARRQTIGADDDQSQQVCVGIDMSARIDTDGGDELLKRLNPFQRLVQVFSKCFHFGHARHAAKSADKPQALIP